MDTVDWDAFLKGWQGQAPTSPTLFSESKLLASSDKNVGSLSSRSLFELCAESLITMGVGAVATPSLNFPMLSFTMKMGKIFADSIPFPKTVKDKHPDE